ncbi:MAG: aldo/keto reductase [Alphaproteobacteria bacterium]|nr:aldo/keto reductase [Alphaproteobacteria bacterium]
MMIETVSLRPGHQISRIIKGGWQLAGDHGPVDRAQSIADMERFLDAGINTFDCADIYVGVEEMIGAFIRNIRRNRGSEAADKINVHTKLVPDYDRLDTMTPTHIEAIVDRSLRRLDLDCLPLVQFFWWDLDRGRPHEVLTCLKDVQAKGKIRHLGVTNWSEADMAPFHAAGLDLVSAQVQYSLLDTRAAGAFSHWCAGHDVQILCYGTLAGGFLTEDWLGADDPGYQFSNRSLVKYRLIIDEFGGWSLFQDLLKVLNAIAVRHGVTVAAVASRWVLDQPQVGAAIIGARTARHLAKTTPVFDLKLEGADQDALSTVLDRRQGPTGRVYGLEGDQSGRHGRIMKYNLGGAS